MIVSVGDAAARTKPSEERLSRAQTKATTLRLGVPELRLRLAAQEDEQRERERKAAAAKLNRACADTNESAEALANALAEADKAARDLVARLADVDLSASTKFPPNRRKRALGAGLRGPTRSS